MTHRLTEHAGPWTCATCHGPITRATDAMVSWTGDGPAAASSWEVVHRPSFDIQDESPTCLPSYEGVTTSHLVALDHFLPTDVDANL